MIMIPSNPPHSIVSGLSRRRLLALTGAAGIGGAVVSTIGTPTTAHADDPPLDYTTRETYDWWLSEIGPVSEIANRPTANETGFWSWHLAGILRSYPMAYRAWQDTRHLDLMIADADVLLSERDSVRGVTDWRGQSLPNWRLRGRYTTGSVTVPDANGLPVLRVHMTWTGPADGSRGTAEILPGSSPDMFTVIVTQRPGSVSTFTDVTLDRQSADYVVPRMYWSEPDDNAARATSLDLRDGNGAGLPVPGTYAITADAVHNLVDTGTIVSGLADFARLILREPRLWRQRMNGARHGTPTYRDKAEEYALAVEQALAVHDPEYRTNSDGEAWYQIDPEGPSGYAGADRPHNQNLMMAASYLLLADALPTRADDFRERAAALVRRFKNDLITVDDHYVWHYNDRQGWFFSGWDRADHVSPRVPFSRIGRGYQPIEDIGHATLDYFAITTAAEAGVVLDDQDMAAFVATWRNMVSQSEDGTPAASWYVDGSFPPDLDPDALAAMKLKTAQRAGSFGRLRPWSQIAYDDALAVFSTTPPVAARASIGASIGTLAPFGTDWWN